MLQLYSLICMHACMYEWLKILVLALEYVRIYVCMYVCMYVMKPEWIRTAIAMN